MSFLIRSALVALVLSFASAAFAQGGDSVEAAREEFWLGNDAYVAGDYPGALSHFQRAYELAPNARLLEFMGRTYVGMGRYVDAVDAFERFAEDEPEMAESVAETIAGLRADMQTAAFRTAASIIDSGIGRARGEQPTSQADARNQLGTRMTNVPLQILSTPRAADVFIDGVEFGSFGVTPLETRLFTGPHLIEVRKPFYQAQSRVVNVALPRRGESITVVEFTLAREQVASEISVRPLTARVVHVGEDGVRTDLGTGGWEGQLPAGPGTFIVQNAGRDRRVEIVVATPDEGGPFVAELSLDEGLGSSAIAISIGTLVVSTQVDEGVVRVDGRVIGNGIGEFEAQLTPGPHSLEVSRDGYVTFEQTVTISANTSSTVYINALERDGRRRR